MFCDALKPLYLGGLRAIYVFRLVFKAQDFCFWNAARLLPSAFLPALRPPPFFAFVHSQPEKGNTQGGSIQIGRDQRAPLPILVGHDHFRAGDH